MARSKVSAVEALKQLRSEQEKLSARESELKAKAASELGRILVDAGAEVLDPANLRTLVKRELELGIDPALERLRAAR